MNTENLNRSLVEFVGLLIALASVIIIILGIQSLAYVINSVLLAVVIAVAVLPIPQKLMKRGMNQNLAFILTLLIIVVVLVVIGMMVYYGLQRIATDLTVSETEASTSESTSLVSRMQEMVGPEELNRFIGAIVSGVGQLLGQFFTVVMIFIFMLSALIVNPISKRADRKELPRTGKITDFTKDIQHYISITTVVNVLVGLGNAILLWILGVPGAVLWGLFSWFTGYIPIVGFWLAMIPPLLIAWVTMDIRTTAIVFAGYVLINGSVENIIKPRIMGEGLNLSALVVFVSLFFWGWLLGGIGAILAIPLTMMIVIVLESFEATRWMVVFLQSPSSTEEHEKEEASGKLKDLWGKVTNYVTRKDDESEGDESEGDS